MKCLILNGPNINLLGLRQPKYYGHTSYETLRQDLAAYGQELNIELEFYQSNSEGALIDRLHQAYADKVDGIIFNPAAYTHTSIALLDALLAIGIPTVEVHISDIHQRESFRQISYVNRACIHQIAGQGVKGYKIALDYLIDYLSNVDSQ